MSSSPADKKPTPASAQVTAFPKKDAESQEASSEPVSKEGSSDTAKAPPPKAKPAPAKAPAKPAPAKAAATAKPAAKPKPAPKGKPPAPKPKVAEEPYIVPDPAPKATMRKRHYGLLASFVLWVLVPMAAISTYLYTRAADQYASVVAFSVRAAETSPAVEILGGITQLGGAGTQDTDVLYEYMRSQRIVADIGTYLDLEEIFSKPEDDPVFAYHAPGTIEDLTRYWRRMVRLDYDSSARLIEVRVLAFSAEEANQIAQAIFQESSRVVNELSDIARNDTTRYARQELDAALQRLREARAAIVGFRNRYQLIDPSLDVQAQMQIFSTLEQQKTEALIELDLLRGTTREDDPRIERLEQRLAVIEERLAEERKRMSTGLSGVGTDESYSEILVQYEGLVVDREFAEQSYVAARASYDSALMEASRQSRYLAPHIQPTLAEKAEYPRRLIFSGVAALFLFLSWGIGALVYYSLKERG